MIQWSLTLTGNQIAILKALEGRVFGEEWNGALEINHWITGVRPLLREGLIEHVQNKTKGGYADPDRSGQFITDRGRFILNMIEEDIAKFLNAKDKASQSKSKKRAA